MRGRSPAAAAALGEYAVEIGERGAIERHESGRFTFEEIRLPTIRASVEGPRAPQVAPSRVTLDLSLAYLSGGAVNKAPVKLRTMVEPREISLTDYPRFSFTGEDIVPGIVRLDGSDEPGSTPTRARVGPVTLSPNGTARVVVDRLTPVTRPSTLVAEMDYDDANGEVATVTGMVSLDPASIRVGIAKDGWIAKADDVRLTLVALDVADKPVKGQRIDVTLLSRGTYSYRKRLIGGFFSYDNSRETKKLGGGCSGTSDAKGLVSCRLDAGVSGEVIALATAIDGQGHVACATQSLWLAGDDDWWFGGDNGDRMNVVPEAPEYAAGTMAKFQVRMPFREATALVSVLRNGVIDSFVTTLSGRDPVVEVQPKRGYAPDVYVSVTAVRGRVAGRRLWLADLARRWNLPWISREAASPTSLIDLAKPSYRFGMTMIRVGWGDHRLAVKVAATTVQVTPPKGRSLPAGSEIAFAAIDEALLQLRPNASWDVLTAMMADRPVAVLTSTAQTQVVGKRHYGRKAVAAAPVSGTTTATLGRAAKASAWTPDAPPPLAMLAWPQGTAPFSLSQVGTGTPWAIVTSRAAVPLTKAFISGFAVRRAVTPVMQAVAGRWSRGDVMRVRVEFTPRAPLQWVVVNDPVPAGATILRGSLGGRSEILTAGATTGIQPTFVERRTDAVHAHYESVPKAIVAYEYTLRLNSAGSFRLPLTGVEALYLPEMMALVPNAPVEVAAKP